jgi:hypothetical protein
MGALTTRATSERRERHRGLHRLWTVVTCAIRRRPRVPRVRREADLVVDHDVDGPVGGVVGQVRQVHRFENDALTAEGGVSVEEDRHDLLALAVAPVELFGSCFPLDNRIDSFEMRGVGDHRQADVLVGDAVQPLDVGPQVVLHVAGAVVGRFQTGKLSEELVEGLATHVGQHVETPPVGHTHNDALHAQLGRLVDHVLHGGDQDFAALETEALLR